MAKIILEEMLTPELKIEVYDNDEIVLLDTTCKDKITLPVEKGFALMRFMVDLYKNKKRSR